MSVKSELKKLVAACEGEVTKNTIPGLLGDIARALGGTGNGKTAAEQIHNIAVAKGYVEPVEESAEPTENPATE